jgi:predicted membrane protein
VDTQNLYKVITSYFVYLAPILFSINYFIFSLKQQLSTALLFCVTLFSLGSIAGMSLLNKPSNLIFLYFFSIPYLVLTLDSASILCKKEWAKPLKVMSILQVLLVVCVLIIFNIFSSKSHRFTYLPERFMILSLGILLFFSFKYQQNQEVKKTAFFKILSGINLIACWIYFSKITFSHESFLFNFEI